MSLFGIKWIQQPILAKNKLLVRKGKLTEVGKTKKRIEEEMEGVALLKESIKNWRQWPMTWGGTNQVNDAAE